jgi:glycosyltransferase involved in cell wall biosynthesis
MNPKITVLTTVYNGLPYLKEAIESVLYQAYTNFEFVIIDDASTDDSVDLIKSYKDSRIRFFQNKNNIGQTASLNKGLEIAEGEYIARLDQDDVCLPERLEEQLDYLERNPSITVISSWEHTIDSNGIKVRSWKRSLDNYGVFIGYILLGLCPVWHPSVMFKRSDILKLNGFDTDYGPAEDFELWSRIALNRMNASFVPKFHLLQRVHGNNQSLLQNDKQVISNRRAQRKVISNFVPEEDLDDIIVLLRLEKSSSGQLYNKYEVKNISEKLNGMLSNIRKTKNLSNKEFVSLRTKIFMRVGYGVLFASVLCKLPNIIFYPIFYLISPLQIPNLRVKLSAFLSRIQRLRYLFK